MIRSRLINRYSSSLSLLLLICAAGANAAEVPMRAYSASYNLYKGGMHVANTEIKLQHVGENWRWSSLTTARGVYAWFVRKQPYTETSFHRHEDGFRLQEIIIGDAAKKKTLESARFDWDKDEMEVLRKGKRRQVRLGETVYDYQSIHLLAAAMILQGVETATVDFYRKGKLVKSRFVFSGREQVDINGQSTEANVFEQVVTRSNSKIRYYYDADNPLLPLRVERLESGESPAVLTLREVDWTL